MVRTTLSGLVELVKQEETGGRRQEGGDRRQETGDRSTERQGAGGRR
jgi:hypothetical protein